MAQQVRAFDWSQTPLGPMENWPAELRIAVDICLSSRFPMFVWWGPELINIYNDGYVPMLGKRHPAALGRPARDSWKEIWHVVGPQADAVMQRGEATWNERVLLVMERKGYSEDTYFTWSYSPIRDAQGGVRGLFCAVTEETARMRAELRDTFLLKLDEAVRPLTDPAQITATCARLLGEHLNADRCAYADVEADEDTFNLTGDYNRGVPSIVGRYRFADFGAEVLRLMREDKPYVVEDIDAHQPPVGDLAYYRQTNIQSVICVPLHKAGRFVAAMAVHQTTPRRWLPEEVDLVRHVAARCWESIERSRVERTLREMAQRFEQQSRLFERIASTTPDFIYVFDRDGRFLYANKRLLEVWGKTFDEAVGKNLYELGYPKWHADMHLREIQQVIETKQPIKGEVPFTGGSGISGVYEYIFTPVLGPDGAVEVIAGTTRDVTARKRGEDERQELLAREREARADAERASEAKSDFLAALSHELRTPLTPVLLTASIIESHPLLPPELREDIATIRRNVELESRLISDLLDLTRISRGKLQLDMREQDLHRLIGSAVDVCQREASAKLIVDLSARHRAVTGDSTRLQQIFWNLINNAIKFTPDDGKITVRSTNVTVNDDPVIRVEVIDTGEGIDPMVLPKLFNAFEQGEVRSVRQQAGLGLGLTISKKLAEAHGGTIRAFSEGRGRGSVFTVDLPVLVEHVETSAAPQLPVSTPAGMQPLSVLLVEDHEPTLRVMERLLRQIGHQVTGVQSVAAATSAAARDAYDLIISDLGLPDGSGLDVMRQLRDRYGDRSIALTGYGMESDIVASRDAGFSEHLTKPVDLAALEAAIARVVKTVKTVRPELATASKERNGHSHDGDH